MGSTETSRGLTNLVGYTILFGLVTVGAASVVLVGGAAVQDSQQQADTELAIQTFKSVDEEVKNLDYNTESSASVGVNQLDGKMVATNDEATVNVTISPENSGKRCSTGEIEMGTIRYERGGETVAVYQGGAVFELTDGTAVHSSPNLEYHRGSLQLPILRFEEGIEASSAITLASNVSETHNKTKTFSKEVRDCLRHAADGDNLPTITVTVHSEYTEGWNRYLEEEYPLQQTTVDESDDTVTTVFEPPSRISEDLHLCKEGDDMGDKYRWNDHEANNNSTETDVRIKCEDDQVRVRYDHELIDNNISIKNNGTHRVFINDDNSSHEYHNNTRWRFNQSTRELYRLHSYDVEINGSWQEETGGTWSNTGSDYSFHSANDSWKRDDDDVEDFPENISMGPPEFIVGSILNKHPFLTAENLTTDEGDNTEELLEGLRELESSDRTEASHVQIRIYTVAADESD